MNFAKVLKQLVGTPPVAASPLEGLSALRKRLSKRNEKDVCTDTLSELAELVLKKNVFSFNEKTLKQKRGTAIGTKFALPYSILFMVELEKKILKKLIINHGGDIEMTSFLPGNMGKKS